jgi:hypothetical protein
MYFPWRSLRGTTSPPVSEPLTNDHVNEAFEKGEILSETVSDERLLSLLRVLCTTRQQDSPNQMNANNRCITINTILTHRLTKKIDRSTTRLSWFMALLAGAGLIATFF